MDTERLDNNFQVRTTTAVILNLRVSTGALERKDDSAEGICTTKAARGE